MTGLDRSACSFQGLGTCGGVVLPQQIVQPCRAGLGKSPLQALRHGPEAYPYQQTQGLACTLGYTLLSTCGFGYTDLAFARLPPFGDPVDRGQPLLGPACMARR